MRLIDADKFKEEIMLIMQCWNISPVLSPSEANKAKSNLRTVLNVLSDMPTVYDVDEVCKKINENKEIDNLIDADQAIKIVKSGGIKNGN